MSDPLEAGPEADNIFGGYPVARPVPRSSSPIPGPSWAGKHSGTQQDEVF